MDKLQQTPTGHAGSDAGATIWSTVDGLDIEVGPVAAGQRRVGGKGGSAAVDLADLVHDRSDWAAAERRAAIGALFSGAFFSGLTRGLLRRVGHAANRVAAAGRALSARPSNRAAAQRG
jgi:hypothetical protein